MLDVIDHPLIQSELTRLRDVDCPGPEFRQRVRRIASLMVPSVTSHLSTRVVSCETPLEITSGVALERPLVLAPILRAGIGYLDGFLDLLPDARVAHIGLARNEATLKPEPYYFKAPADLENSDIIVLDPMLATGGSVIEAIRTLQSAGAKNFSFACLVASPEGVQAVESVFPDMPIYTAALDRCLNEKGYILPGLGDAGDRLFGT